MLDPFALLIVVNASELTDTAKPRLAHAATDAVVLAVLVGWNSAVSGQGYDRLFVSGGLSTVTYFSVWRMVGFLSLGSQRWS